MKKTFSVLFCFMLLFCSASAHAGRTDAAGGHWDRSSGTYHYHHGYPAHQHTNGICPYDYDDQTGINSGTVSSSKSSSVSASTQSQESTEPPEGYPYPDTYEIAPGSRLIDRTYYFNENGFMYTPYPFDDIPHGATETDNSSFLQFDSVTLNQVVYQYGLEDRSRQFQEGALYGIHEASCYYNQWYEQGYQDGQIEDEPSTPIEYPYDRDDGTYETAYNAGYTRGCALLIEMHSDLLPNVNTLTGQLSASNRLDGETPLTDYGATFESAYEDGFYQSETDFFAKLDSYIVSAESAESNKNSEEISQENKIVNNVESHSEETQSESDDGIPWRAVALMSLLLVLTIYIYYRSKEENTRS